MDKINLTDDDDCIDYSYSNEDHYNELRIIENAQEVDIHNALNCDFIEALEENSRQINNITIHNDICHMLDILFTNKYDKSSILYIDDYYHAD